MAEKSLRKAFEAFSSKMKQFNSAEDKKYEKSLSSDQKLQLSIEEREELLRKSVLKNFDAFINPVSKSIEEDEKNLLEAYDLFMEIQALVENKKDSEIKILDVRISSPLSLRECYTKGSQFIYLLCWFMKEKNNPEYLPFFEQSEGSRCILNFMKADEYHWTSDDKQILSILSAQNI